MWKSTISEQVESHGHPDVEIKRVSVKQWILHKIELKKSYFTDTQAFLPETVSQFSIARP